MSPTSQTRGTALCVLSACAFGAMAIVGLREVGPATASIVSTAEPVVTVALATAIYGEALGAGQLAGGVLVLGAVVILQLRTASTVEGDVAPAHAPALPQLARSRTTLPEGDGWAYEPKLDGFRALVFVDGETVEIASRNGKPLDRYFPEVVASLPAGRYVLDGEIVASSFDTLGQRIHPAKSRIERLSVETPARMVAFDLLALDDDVCWSGPTASGAPRWRRRRWTASS